MTTKSIVLTANFRDANGDVYSMEALKRLADQHPDQFWIEGNHLMTNQIPDNFIHILGGKMINLELTWTCHVCGQERPDQFISVYKSFVVKHGITIQQNVRYCNDNPDCTAKAPDVKFIKPDK